MVRVLLWDEDFETADSLDSTKPDGWVRWQSTSSTTYLDNNNAFEGGNALTVETDTSAGWQVIETTIDYDASVDYQLKFMAKADNINVGGKVEVLNATDNVVIQQLTFTDTS